MNRIVTLGVEDANWVAASRRRRGEPLMARLQPPVAPTGFYTSLKLCVSED